MSPAGWGLLGAYYVTLGMLVLYGAHRLLLLRLHARARRRPPAPPDPLDPLPRITVQLPLYNEIYVVERLIRAACGLDYPSDRLQIQVLDDSTDGTVAVAARLVRALRRRGHDIVHLRRRERRGFKAGALAYGLARAGGELIAVFDADFVPPPRFLLDLVGHFGDPRVGMVQARWGHLNRDYSLLTRLQSILLDGHFVIEHQARHRAGLFFNFNGTAGIWRRACIESAGGWQSDTLTEDLDLSYRAQLEGWKFVFVSDVVAPAELPADIDAFRTQQQRWARGSIETGRKILPRLLRARLPLPIKLEGLVHLTNNGAYLLLTLLAILSVPAVVVRHRAGLDPLLLLDLPLLLISTGSLSAFYLRAQRDTGVGRLRRLAALPLLMLLGIGLCLGNARAVLGALAGPRAAFVRTPKHALRGTQGRWWRSNYRTRADVWTLLDPCFALYFAGAAVWAVRSSLFAALPCLLLFLGGFLYASGLTVDRALRHRLFSSPPPRSAYAIKRIFFTPSP
jgi:cellulose synthase/poly-beta-1,6-N-acetylglucosamine synthase-like glycosyltransferase